MLTFLAELRNGGAGSGLYAQALATQIAVHVLRRYSTNPSQAASALDRPVVATSDRALRRAREYMDEHAAEALSLDAIAAVANLSARHFSRLFKQTHGSAPHQYLLERRVERARHMLEVTDLTVAEVAVACGFVHQGHLGRHFVRRVGATPQLYRDQSRR